MSVITEAQGRLQENEMEVDPSTSTQARNAAAAPGEWLAGKCFACRAGGVVRGWCPAGKQVLPVDEGLEAPGRVS